MPILTLHLNNDIILVRQPDESIKKYYLLSIKNVITASLNLLLNQIIYVLLYKLLNKLKPFFQFNLFHFFNLHRILELSHWEKLPV